MSITSDLKTTFNTLGIPFETGVWSKNAPDEYVVVIPLDDSFPLHGDDIPEIVLEEARIALYKKGNYTAVKERIVKKLIEEGYTITDMTYIDYEVDTKYHHYNIDVAKHYDFNIGGN